MKMKTGWAENCGVVCKQTFEKRENSGYHQRSCYVQCTTSPYERIFDIIFLVLTKILLKNMNIDGKCPTSKSYSSITSCQTSRNRGRHFARSHMTKFEIKSGKYTFTSISRSHRVTLFPFVSHYSLCMYLSIHLLYHSVCCQIWWFPHERPTLNFINETMLCFSWNIHLDPNWKLPNCNNRYVTYTYGMVSLLFMLSNMFVRIAMRAALVTQNKIWHENFVKSIPSSKHPLNWTKKLGVSHVMTNLINSLTNWAFIFIWLAPHIRLCGPNEEQKNLIWKERNIYIKKTYNVPYVASLETNVYICSGQKLIDGILYFFEW